MLCFWGMDWGCTYTQTHTLTGLLGLGATGELVGLAPHGDSIVQQLQRTSPLPAWGAYLHHAGAFQHHLHVLIFLYTWTRRQRDVERQGETEREEREKYNK